MVQSIEIRQAFVCRLKESAAAAGIPDWGLGARLAEITKVTPKATSKWLNAESMPGRSNMEAVAKAFGVRIEWLEYGHGEMRASELKQPLQLVQGEGAPTRSSADVVRQMLEKHGKALSEDARRKIVDAVEAEAPAQPASNVITADFSRSTVVKGDTISIAQYDVRAAMGAGQVPAEYREFVRNLVVDKVQLDDLGIKYTAPTNLKIITGWGQSMLGTIDDKSPLIVDIGITEFVEEGVYVFTWLQHLYVKRVQVLDAEHYKLVSDNKVFDPQTARMEDVHFHAKVLGVWNFKRL
ncbi:LexA family transcriptional regulator [Pseudomonas knackmussii]|uniref:LexA family transcriptional regulator n=1 Tax=Pseudomonas knackmussii TaxID=65741 RepID=UPI001362E020|nr:LexA family transcriptional regulator [Pseudomonas knackmussii]